MGDFVKIAVLSDTHGMIRPDLAETLTNCDLVIHAGDIDDADTLASLRNMCPACRIVRGNCDYGAWAEELPMFELFDFTGFSFYVRHIPWQIDIDPVAAGVDVVITGHTHRAEMKRDSGILFLNPGSAGPASSGNKASAALIIIKQSDLSTKFLEFAS